VNLRQPLFSILPRGRASIVLLLAALVMASVATTLVAAVPLYSTAVIEAGLRSTLADAPPAESGLEATFRADASAWVSTTTDLESIGSSRLPGVLTTATLARTDTYALPSELDDDGRITSIGAITSTRPMLRVVDGPVVQSGADALAARLHVDAASLLGLGLGDRVQLTRGDGPPVVLELVALVEPIDQFDDLWFDQPVFREGLTAGGSFTEIGPFLVEPADFSTFTDTANYRWRAIPEPDSVTTGDLDRLRRGASDIDRRLADRLDTERVAVATELPALVADTDRAIGSTAAVIAAILIQLVGVALYGVGLSASVLVSTRAVETTMLRSRGATAEQLGVMAAVEALLIAVPAVVLGPWLGARVVEAVERWGPVASAGLDLRPTASVAAWVASIIVGVLVVAIVAWPAVRSARGFADAEAARSRPDGPLGLQRAGLDIGVALLAALGLWRLSGSGAATTDLAGRLGTDPVLVLAPMLGVIAASLLTLRLISGVATIAQRFTSSRGVLSLALAGWELARRPGRTARTSVLVVLSVTVGTFAAVHAASWQRSLGDQADASVSADSTVVPDPRPTAIIEPRFVPDSYRQLAGITGVVPVDRLTATLSTNLGPVSVIATDTTQLVDTLRLRSDLYGAERSATSLGGIFAPGDLGGIELGEVTGDLKIQYELLAQPSTAAGVIRVSVVFIDGYGTLVRADADPIPIEETAGELTFRLTSADVPGIELAVTGPARLIEIQVSAPAVQDRRSNEDPLPSAVFDLDLRSPRVGSREISLDDDWVVGGVTLGNPLAAPAVSAGGTAEGLELRLDTGLTEQTSGVLRAHFGTGEFGVGNGFEVPVLVTPQLLADTELQVGDVVAARISGTRVELRIDGVIPVVPFDVDEPVAMLVDWETISVDRWSRSRRFERVDEWALTTDAERADQIGRTLSGAPYSSVSYVDRRQQAVENARAPVTVGLAGSLGLALVSSLVIAAIGLILTAVVGARERRATFALLRAMGTRVSELRGWLFLETVPLVGLSAAAGLGSGIALAELALPSLAIGGDGSRSVPKPVLVVPWTTITVIVAVAVAAGMALPVVTGRLLRRHRTADELRIGDTS